MAPSPLRLTKDIMDDTDNNEKHDGPLTDDFNIGSLSDENDIDDDDDITQTDEVDINPIMTFSQQINMDVVRDHGMANITTNATHEFYVGL